MEHQALLKSLPERLQQEPTQAPPENLSQLRCEVIDYLASTINTNRGAGLESGQVPALVWPPTMRRDTFKDILTDAEVPVTPQGLV